MAHISYYSNLGPIVFTRILNQFKGHYLFNDASNYAISMNLKFKNKIDFATFDNLMEEDAYVVFGLSCFASNMKNKIVGVLDSFISFF